MPANIYNTSGSAGSAAGPARADHVHLGIPVPPASNNSISFGASNNFLISTGGAAGDVEWGDPGYAAIDSTAADISTIDLAGDAHAAGSVGLAADAGHVHQFAGVVASYVATNTNRTPNAGELTLFYGLPATRALTLPAASSTPAFTINWVVNANGSYNINVDPGGSDNLIGFGGNGASGTVNVPANSSAAFVRTSSTQWSQLN